MNFFAESSAKFSRCKKYRYTLHRRWGKGKIANFILLNPSTADEFKNDPTVERCCRRTHNLGYGGIIVTNIFAWRATDPKELRTAPDPVGRQNNKAIIESALAADLVVCGWGNHGLYKDRSTKIFEILKGNNIKAMCLKVTNQGQPSHPLYVSYDTPLVVLA